MSTILTLIQGSEEWHQHRMLYLNRPGFRGGWLV